MFAACCTVTMQQKVCNDIKQKAIVRVLPDFVFVEFIPMRLRIVIMSPFPQGGGIKHRWPLSVCLSAPDCDQERTLDVHFVVKPLENTPYFHFQSFDLTLKVRV